MPDPGEKGRLSRRRVVKLGAGMAAATLVLAHEPIQASAATNAATRHYFSRVARVTSVTDDRLESLSLATQESLAAPIVGFPFAVMPRIGDLVTITDSIPGYTLAAVPLCTWHRGVVTQLTSSVAEIDGVRALNSAVLPTALEGQSVLAYLLDTSLSEHVVLAVKP